MGLYKRGAVWWMRFMFDGQQIRRSTETDDQKLAKRIFDKLKGEIAEGKWFKRLPGEDFTFKDLIEKYLKEYSATNKAASSHKRDQSLTDHLLEVFRDYYLPDITTAMIADYKVKRRDEKASPRTINYELTLMSHAFNIAIREWEWIKDNPVRNVRKERINNHIERWLTQDEEERLLKVSPRWLQKIIVFAINTGLRQSEILDLKWSQVDMARRTITILEQKNRCIDTLPVDETAMDVLRERQRDGLPECNLVFPGQNGTRILNRNLFRAFNVATGRAEIDRFRFHDLRHTFATRLVQNGVGIYEVQKLGRWKNSSMVMRYAHHNSDSLRPAIEMMDGRLLPVSTNLAHSQKNRGQKPLLRLVTP